MPKSAGATNRDRDVDAESDGKPGRGTGRPKREVERRLHKMGRPRVTHREVHQEMEGKGRGRENREEGWVGTWGLPYPIFPHPRGTAWLGLGCHRLANGSAPHEQVQGLGGTANDGGWQAVEEEVGPGTLPYQGHQGPRGQSEARSLPAAPPESTVHAALLSAATGLPSQPYLPGLQGPACG